MKRIVRAHMQRLDSSRRRTVVVVPAAKVGEAELGRQAARRRSLSTWRYRWRRKLGVHWRCSRARGYSYGDRAVVEASSCARRRRRAGLRYRWRRRVVLRKGVRYVLALGVCGRVGWWWGGHGVFMSRQILCAYGMDCHVCLLRCILHAGSPVASPLLRIVWGSHWRARYRRRRIRRRRIVGERGERA